MLEDQPRFIADLARLPQTLCHHDAARSNLIAGRPAHGGTQIMAIDWESTGSGAVGAEIATLVSASLRKGDLPADHASELDSAVPYEAAFLAGKSFLRYRQGGGAKRSSLPDFYIGAHAAVAGYRLLTRDATLYRTYLPKLELIAP